MFAQAGLDRRGGGIGGVFCPTGEQNVATPNTVMPRFDRGIQYAAACRFQPCCLWNAGLPAFAGNDTEFGTGGYSADSRTIWRPPFISLRRLTKFSGRCQRLGASRPMNSAMSPMKPVQLTVSAFHTGELACNFLI